MSVLASSIREMFDEGELFIYYRDNRPYKKHIARYIRNLNGVFTVPGDAPIGMLMDYFDPYGGRFPSGNELFEKSRLKDSDIVLSGAMLHEYALNALPLTTLRPPPKSVEANDNALMALGLDPMKWVACVYWKESGYKYRWEDAQRIIYDAAPYIAVIRHIIENLGGQVIRLGHPTPLEIPKMPGFFDLAKVEGSEALQLYSVSIARFFIGSGSGPIAYGPAMNVPTAVTDQNYCLSAWNPHDYIVTQGLVHEGRVLRQTDAFDAGYLQPGKKPASEFNLVRNTAAELIAATDEMFKTTTSCIGWRSTAEPEPKLPRPNTIGFPIPRNYNRELLIPPSQRPKA